MKLKFKLLAILVGAAVALPSLAEVTYRKDIAPFVKKRCIECHFPENGSVTLQEYDLDIEKYSKKDKVGPRLDSYENLTALIAFPDPGALMRRLDDGSGKADKKPGNMYEKLGDTDAERAANLKMFKAWLGEGGWNFNRWVPKDGVPAITKEQLDKLILAY